MINLDFRGKKKKKAIESLLAEVQNLPDADKENISMFLEDGEWGVAFDALCSQIFENEINISAEMYDRIERLGMEMQIDPSEWRFLISQILK